MALNATVLSITQPGATGNQTYSLPSNFDPKAIIVLGSINNGANGAVAQGSMCIGFGTYRGGVVQQMWCAATTQDAVAAANSFGRTGNDAVMKLTNGQNNTIVSNVALVSMQTGATSQIVLNWVTRDTVNTGKKILVLVLGGSDITDALAGTAFTGTGGAGNQDVTVASGFGKPDVLFVAHGGDTTQVATFGSGSPFSFAFNNQAAGGRLILANHIDGGTADVRGRVDTNKILYGGLSTTVTHDAVLADPVNWPTDGFRITYTTRSATWPFDFLALKLSANAVCTVGNATAPASGTQSLNGSAGLARALFIMGQRTTTVGADVTSGADNLYSSYGVAANDGTDGLVGMLALDGAATTVTDSMFDNSKAINYYNPTGEAKTAESDATASAGAFALNWSTPSASAFAYQWLMLSEIVASSGPPPGNFFPFIDAATI